MAKVLKGTLVQTDIFRTERNMGACEYRPFQVILRLDL